jgi:hypothetical protein
MSMADRVGYHMEEEGNGGDSRDSDKRQLDRAEAAETRRAGRSGGRAES